MVWDKIGGALKGALFEEDPNAPKPAAAPPQAPAQPGQQVSAQSAPTMMSAAPSVYATPGVNMDMVTAIKKAIFSRATPFTTLMAAADKLASILPDVNTRLKAAFATASDGRSAKQVADAVDIHLVDVDGEERKFAGALQARTQQDIGSAQQRVAGLKAASDSATAQIAALQAQIQAAQETIQRNAVDVSTLEAEIATKTIELQNAERDFKIAADFVRSELAANKQAILSSLN